MSWWSSFVDWLRSLFWSQEMELTLVGLQNSGKSTLVNVITVRALLMTGRIAHGCAWPQGGGFDEEIVPTIGFSMKKVTKGNVTMKLWDIGGQQRFRTMWERYCRGVDAIVYAARHPRCTSDRAVR